MLGVETVKGKRQEKILEIIKDRIILTQDDLQNALNEDGYNVTQSTISRDIKELKLIKGHDSEGNYRYVVHNVRTVGGQSISHYKDIINRSVIGVDYSLNNVVIKCYTGMASSTCVAIDTIFSGRMLGTIAGEDTILLITKSENDSLLLCEEIKRMM